MIETVNLLVLLCYRNYAGHAIAQWKEKEGKSTIPATTRAAIVGKIVKHIEKWHFARRKRPSDHRVLELLRSPRNRRL
jgi:hypothetical protein